MNNAPGIKKVDGYLYNSKVYATKEEAEIMWTVDTLRNEYMSLEADLKQEYPNFIKNIEAGGTNWGQCVVDKMLLYMKLRTEMIELANKNNKDNE